MNLVNNKNYIGSLETYYEYINDTLSKAKIINADFISYDEVAFTLEEENYNKFVNKISSIEVK